MHKSFLQCMTSREVFGELASLYSLRFKVYALQFTVYALQFMV